MRIPEPIAWLSSVVAGLILAVVVLSYVINKNDASSQEKRAKWKNEHAQIEKQMEEKLAAAALQVAREGAAISRKCPLEKVLLVKHYKARDAYCLDVCGTYLWFGGYNWDDDRDCSWLAEKEKHP